jgi:hypothetical protein
MRHLKVPFAVLLGLVLCLYLLLFPPLGGGSKVNSSVDTTLHDSGVDFVYEKIVLEVEPPELTVTGLYSFQNHFPHEIILPMLYPFPVDESQDFPHQISAFRITNEGDERLDVTSRRPANAVRLDLSMGRKSSGEMKVTYSQKLRAQEARYILTTTKAWGKPLRSADYEIIVPENLRIISMSFPFDGVETSAGKRHYYLHKEDFMPQTDLIVRWD